MSGVGRPDYSIEVSRSVSSTVLNQIAIGLSFSALVPTIPYPFMYNIVLALSSASTNYAIPRGYPLWGYNLSCSGDTNAISVIGAQIYNNFDALTDTVSNLYETIFLKFAPFNAELHATRGFNIGKYADKYLSLVFAHYSANPFCLINVSVHGLVDVGVLRELAQQVGSTIVI